MPAAFVPKNDLQHPIRMSYPSSLLESLLIRRKVFVSFHHADQYYRDRWDTFFRHLFISKSVGEGEIDDSNSSDYIAALIRQNYVEDSSVMVVLIGPLTYCRKHVDWEIAAALDPRVGGCRAGLVGLFLPNTTAYYGGTSLIPDRLYDNVQSGYARLYNWTENALEVKGFVEEAFDARSKLSDLARNGRVQMSRNSC